MQPDFLSQLNDIQTPEQIGWWPLAWGWYAIIALALILMVIAIILLVRHIRINRAKRQALKMLNALNKSNNPRHVVSEVNNILKRVALSYTDRPQVAELSGEAWAHWLNQYAKPKFQIEKQLLSLAYAPNCKEDQAKKYLQQVTTWVSNCLPLKKKSKSEVSNHV